MCKYATAIVAVLIVTMLMSATDDAFGQKAPGKLTVNVAFGEEGGAPADHVHVIAYGLTPDGRDPKAVILLEVTKGRYEASIPSGVYDILVSENTSRPLCRRIFVKAGATTDWNVTLELDRLYTYR